MLGTLHAAVYAPTVSRNYGYSYQQYYSPTDILFQAIIALGFIWVVFNIIDKK